MCLARGPQRSNAGEARTHGPSFSSQALYHWATALPQLCRDRSSWVEPVLSKDKCVLLKDITQWRRWDSNPRPRVKHSTTEPLCSLIRLENIVRSFLSDCLWQVLLHLFFRFIYPLNIQYIEDLTWVLMFYWNYYTSWGKENKCEACRAFYLFSATSLINSIIQEHEC